MKIKLSSLMVTDQEKALQFYTSVLGFVKKLDIPMGEYRWLTVVSPESADGPDQMELVLEPLGFPPARTYQQALREAGIPSTMFFVDDIAAEHARLEKLGVQFKTAPMQAGPVQIAIFDDTCGNWIQIVQM